MGEPIDIAAVRRLLTPVVDCHAERFRIGEPTHRDRLMVWVLNNLGSALDEVELLRSECHGRRFDPNLVAENKQLRADLAHLQNDAGPDSCADFVVRLRAELAEAHEALTAEIAAHQRTSASLSETAQELRARLDGVCERCQERCNHG